MSKFHWIVSESFDKAQRNLSETFVTGGNDKYKNVLPEIVVWQRIWHKRTTEVCVSTLSLLLCMKITEVIFPHTQIIGLRKQQNKFAYVPVRSTFPS